ncbi:MAG: glycosyltransferase family 2 protein, partial [Huintestinicola sp.]
MISIVMPVYNGQKYLSQAIDSILDQTYTDWELIIVNDHSTDSTSDIILRYSKIDSRIKIINNEINQKLPRSLNIGFKNASGEYYTWTSDDNILHPDLLQKMASFLDADPDTGLVYTDMNYIDENGKLISTTMNSCHKINLCNCIGASFMYRKEVAEDIGGYDPNKFLV